MRKDKYRWYNTDICMRCDTLVPTPEGNGLRYVICQNCAKELKKQIKHWNKYGLYATKQEALNDPHS